MRRRMSLGFSILILCLLCVTGTALAKERVKGDIKKSFNVKPGGELVLETDIGSIEVKAVSRNVVDVEVRFTPKSGTNRSIRELLEDFDIDFQHRGDDVFIRAEYLRRGSNFWNSIGRYVRVEFFISVPTSYNVDLKTSGGSISVDDLEGDVTSRTSGGSLHFGRIQGSVNGRTSGGSIELIESDGTAVLGTSGGGIRIGRVRGDVDAHTSGGSIDVDEVMGSIEASTSGGSVRAKITSQPENDCRLTTSGGSVTVYLDENVNVDVNASTSGGRVVTDFPVTIRGEISKRSLRAKINGGGPELYLRTSGGSIYIREN